MENKMAPVVDSYHQILLAAFERVIGTIWGSWQFILFFLQRECSFLVCCAVCRHHSFKANRQTLALGNELLQGGIDSSSNANSRVWMWERVNSHNALLQNVLLGEVVDSYADKWFHCARRPQIFGEGHGERGRKLNNDFVANPITEVEATSFDGISFQKAQSWKALVEKAAEAIILNNLKLQ